MFVLQRVTYIEDYYRSLSFVGVYTSKELAEQYVATSQARFLENTYVSYLESEFISELNESNAEGKEKSWNAYREINSQKPKFLGDQKDKEALKIHANLKQEWSKKSVEASDTHSKFMWDNIYEPAKLRSEAMRGSEIPTELLDKIKEWGYKYPKYEIEEAVMDQEYKVKTDY